LKTGYTLLNKLSRLL